MPQVSLHLHLHCLRYGSSCPHVLRYISSGDIARQMHVDDLLNKGELAPEDEMRKRVLESINDTQVSYVLDGCPRFYEQYAWLKGAIVITSTPFVCI